MKIVFKDDDSRPSRIKRDLTGTFVAEIVDVEYFESRNQEPFLRFTFLLDNGSAVRIPLSCVKNKRWRLKILLSNCGIEKDPKKNEYNFETEQLIGKKVVLIFKDGLLMKSQKYEEPTGTDK